MAGTLQIWGTDQELILWHKGICDIDKVYAECREWFERRRYQFYEHYYKQKAPTPAGEEVFIKWTAFVNRTEYIRLQMDLFWHMWDVDPVEIVVDGKKHRAYKGRIKLTHRGKIVTDFKNYFERNAFQHMLREFLDKYIYRVKLTNLSTSFEIESHELLDLIRKNMKAEIKDSAYKGYR